MRVLILHSRYASGSVSGENRVVDDEARILKQGNHAVIVSAPSTTAAGAESKASIRAGAAAIWGRDAARIAHGLIEAHAPDVVHIHNLFPWLSPNVIRAAASEEIPVVVTLHNYRLMCLPATFVRDGRRCEDCLGKLPWRGVAHACYRGSRAASAAIGVSLGLHRALSTFDQVSLFAAVSSFVRAKHIEGGVAPSRIVVKASFAWPADRRTGPGEYFLYLGRLSSEKGILPLVRSWQPSWPPLIVAGTGPLESHCRQAAGPNVRLVGGLDANAVSAQLARARALVVPSICYEGAPRSVLEAYAAGVPVVAAGVGALPELVIHETTGLVVDPAAAHGWDDAVARLTVDDETERLGDGAYSAWYELYSPEAGLKGLEQLYAAAVQAPRLERTLPPEPAIP